MSVKNRIVENFEQSIRVKQRTLKEVASHIESAATIIASSIEANGKILCCGNGGSAADAQHFAAELINRFERERRSLAAIALPMDTSTLTSIANDEGFEQIFVRPLQALGVKNDVLVAISTSGNSANVTEAIKTAQQQNMAVVALTGKDGGKITGLLGKSDLEIRIPSDSTARIQEAHCLVLHCICDLVDHQLLDQRDSL